MAKADMYLKIDGIEGESEDSQLPKTIEVLSWSWGESNAGSFVHGGGGGTGKVNMQDVSFSVVISKASPLLFNACATGKHIANATLTCRKAGETQNKYLEITLKDVLVSSFQTGGSGGGELPIESFSLNFAEVTYEYFVQGKDGKTTSAGKKTFNLKTNVAS